MIFLMNDKVLDVDMRRLAPPLAAGPVPPQTHYLLVKHGGGK